MTRARTRSVVASPVIVGAVTVLVVTVSVLLAYSANQGLPFVPTYKLRANVPFASNIVRGNDVRVGGFRVGTVSAIDPATVPAPHGGHRPIAQLELKLDKTVEPLPVDTQVMIRPVSSIGLKYVQLTPGRSDTTFAPGSTIPLRNATRPVETDDFTATFDRPTRDALKSGLVDFGDALAGRGSSINDAIQSFAPFFAHLTPVAHTLASPQTQLGRFFVEGARTSELIAPVAAVNAALFGKMADTFAAIGHDAVALQQTIERGPPTLDVGTRSLRVQRPFLADSADLARRLLPAALEIPRTLPFVTHALHAGPPVFPATIDVNTRTRKLLAALDDLSRRPETLPALTDLSTLNRITRPLLTYIAPYESVCNYINYTFTSLGNMQDAEAPGGTIQRVLAKSDNGEQTNRPSVSTNFRPPDVPADQNSKEQQSEHNRGPLTALHGQPYGPAVDSHGNADCQAGQFGYMIGPFGKGRYRPHKDNADWVNKQSGGSHVIVGTNTPGDLGPTFTGVKSLKDVP